MTPRLIPISGCGAKGPACFLVEADQARLLLDLGYGPVPGLWPDVTRVGAVDALLLSHGHRDHAGALELLPQIGNPPVYASDIVARSLPPGTVAASLPLHGRCEVGGIEVTTGRNGHAPGGIWMRLDVGEGLLYMGDYSVESLLYAYDLPERAGTVILDASYGSYDAPLAACMSELDRRIDSGPVLLPVPAAGRGPEIALHALRRAQRPPHIDAAIRSALEHLLTDYGASMKDEAAADIAVLASTAPPIEKPHGVMLACVADATSGDAARLVDAWQHESSPQIVFTGYVPPGTPAETLTRSGRASYVRWNVHPRLADNARLVLDSGALEVVPAFGDSRHTAVWQSAFAPARVVTQGPMPL